MDSAIPKVSVMLITYNHEKYISEALDSILMQERDFDIEINVIDDCSTDSTQKIVRNYQGRYPRIINCYFNERNVGHIATQLNTYRGFQTLRGEYFALLEGDDYWTDPKKLKEQVAFLESNIEYVACAHDTLKTFEDGRPSEHFLPFKAFGRNRARISDLISMAGVFHLSSIVYRNKFGLNPPQCLADPYSCEVIINMLYGQFGDFYCISKYMSAYRVHEGGVFSTRSLESMWLFHIHGYRRFALYMGARYWVLFSRSVIGFSKHALLAHRRSEGPKLGFKTRMIFVIHLFIAGVIFLITKPLDLFAKRNQGYASDYVYMMEHIRGRLKDNYPQMESLIPDFLIWSYLAAESRLPIVRNLRLRWKRHGIDYAHVVERLRLRLMKSFPRLEPFIPNFLIRAYLIIDARISIVRALRLRWKQFFGRSSKERQEVNDG
ncbi:glycosyltransferase family 2 protein [Nitrosospira multiformis]|uniref:Glycosyltransferase involved in cell wall bisynthesis n=1 Tax=Nitrosospira multiformis TaxID=1231 RepID=A0A1I7I7P0_9PROT|nr:glycosyltransferase [Nitrosospira multiformis]SFU68864.1 Glycosyltransferase involved in cell wall bisynthesis [Nitrosospira multiformis]